MKKLGLRLFCIICVIAASAAGDLSSQEPDNVIIKQSKFNLRHLIASVQRLSRSNHLDVSQMKHAEAPVRFLNAFQPGHARLLPLTPFMKGVAVDHAPTNLNSQSASTTASGDFNTSSKMHKSESASANLVIDVNDISLVPWGPIRLIYRIEAINPGTRADLYLALLLNNSSLFFLQENLSLSSTEVPFKSDIEISDSETVILDGDLPDDIPQETIYVYGVLVKPGTSALDLSNWTSNLAWVACVFGSISGDQYELLAQLGSPQFITILFNRASNLREETWVYPPFQLYKFTNGLLQQNLTSVVPPYAGSDLGPPIWLDDIVFRPTTTAQDIREKYGDPTRLLRDTSSNTEVWIFGTAGMIFTVKDNQVNRIEVY